MNNYFGERRKYTVEVAGQAVRVNIRNVRYFGYLQGVRVSLKTQDGKRKDFPRKRDEVYSCYTHEKDPRAISQALFDAGLAKEGEEPFFLPPGTNL